MKGTIQTVVDTVANIFKVNKVTYNFQKTEPNPENVVSDFAEDFSANVRHKLFEAGQERFLKESMRIKVNYFIQ